MASRQFPPIGAEQGTPPNYEPQAFAVRYIADDRRETDYRREEWRKYGTKHHAEAGIRGMQHFAPRIYMFNAITATHYWAPTALIVELWEYLALSTNPQWRLVETRVYRGDVVFTV